MNVLYITPYASKSFLASQGDLNSAGIAGSLKVEYIANGLAAAGHRVVIISSIMTTRSEWRIRRPVQEHYVRAAGSVTIDYPRALKLRPWGGLVNCLRAGQIMRRLTRSFRPDVTIIYNSYLFEVLCAKWLVKRFQMPLWLEVEDLPLARKREHLNIKPMLDNLCWRWAVDNSSAFSAVNSVIWSMLPARKRRELLPGVVSRSLISRADRRTEPFTQVRKTLGYFGGLSAGKGVEVLLEVVNKMPPDWEMVIAGGGEYAAKFAATAHAYPGKLKFAGRLDPEKTFELLCQCDAAVIPKERIAHEGEGVFPFKTFEYISSKVHIISAKLPQLGGYDCNFFQRWDGTTATGLAACLATAPDDYRREAPERETLRTEVLKRCSEAAVGRLACDIVESLRPARNNSAVSALE
jgi:glycosyltransferase involved in cell wall biosynthesis